MSDGGKGSSPRPMDVNQETFDENWNRIFNRPKKTAAEQQAEAWLKNEYYDLDDADEAEGC